MTNSSTSKGIAQPARDAQRSYRRALRPVGAGYRQDVMHYTPGFWRQHAGVLSLWALFQIFWWTVLAMALYGTPASDMLITIVGSFPILLPGVVTLAAPWVWWRRYVAMREVIG